MDPYLEGELWQEFHERLANQISAQLLAQLPRHYVALLAKRYVLDAPALGVFDLPDPRVFFPDVHVVQPPGLTPLPSRPSAAAVDPPAAELLSPAHMPQLGVEIRDVASRRLVSAIEILSPANKLGQGFFDYQARRFELFDTAVHLLEIDLLRQGRRLQLGGRLPQADYYVYLSPFTRRPFTQVWAWHLRSPLPVVPVPLLEPDPDVPLDLMATVRACFDLVGYERLLDYTQPPPPPELDPADSAWLAECLRASGISSAQ
jgi:hypothetical protein